MIREIDEIFASFYEQKKQIEMSLEEFQQNMDRFSNQIVLYGAGSAGVAFLYCLRSVGIYPRYFADGDSRLWGTIREELEILSPQDIMNKAGRNTLVIVTINTDGKQYCKSFEETLRIGGHDRVHKMLREQGVEHLIDYTYFRHCFSLFKQEKYNLPSCSNVYEMCEFQHEIAKVYEMMADDISRETYSKLVAFRLLDESIIIPTFSQATQYFEYTLYGKNEDEVFLDCGAYDGISLKTFLKENGTYFSHYYGFEPDHANYIRLEQYIDTLESNLKAKITCIPKAVSDVVGDEKLYALAGPGSFMADIGNQEVSCLDIDFYMKDNKVTYIKMNIEGAEKKALIGARKTISTWKPKLAIAGYHKTSDLWEIPLLMNAYRPDYKIYLRSYMNHISFVYYGI